MSDVNSVTLSGRLGADVAFKTLPSGTDVAEFRIANESYRGQVGGEPRFDTTWFDCRWTDKRAHALVGSLRKGRWLVVTGRILSYQTEEGEKKGLPPRIFIDVSDVSFAPAPRQDAPRPAAAPRQAPAKQAPTGGDDDGFNY